MLSTKILDTILQLRVRFLSTTEVVLRTGVDVFTKDI